jgi:aldose 1-epimerase
MLVPDSIVQRAGDTVLDIAPRHGGRIRSLRIRGAELLRTGGSSALDWGCYAMAPWTGRVRFGRFQFGGVDYQLPMNMPPHAIHGTLFDVPWRVEDDHWLTADLTPPWPFSGFVRQQIVLSDGALDLRLEVHARDVPMPASCGWHPWLRRRLTDGAPSAVLDVAAAYMLARDADGMPGDRIPSRPGPWDDCFGGVRWPVTITWPGALQLRVSSDCGNAVVFDEPADAVCVEPMTDLPNALNRTPHVVQPGHPLVATCRWEWTSRVC